jgi:lipopolysaccharide transport system permease protein
MRLTGRSLIAETWAGRTLVLSLVRRQYQLRYRQSLVGFSWAVIPPLASMVVATIVFDKTLGVDTGDTPYYLFALAGLAPWSFFAGSVGAGVPSLVASQTMVSRLPFPRASIPLSVVGIGLIDLAITVGLFLVVLILSGEGLPITSLWAFPLLGIEIIFATGIVLIGSALNVFARDIRLAVPLMLQMWLYLTPVMYPLSEVPDNLKPLFKANPMTGLIESFRRVLIDGHPPVPSVLVPSLIGTVIAVAFGFWYFGATRSRFADVI